MKKIESIEATKERLGKVAKSLIGYPESVLTQPSLVTRVIHPNQVITRDYNPVRLNYTVDSGGIIQGFHWG